MPRRAATYITVVILAGAAALALILASPGAWRHHDVSLVVLLLAGVLIGEFNPIRVRRPGAEGEITPSTTFLYALLLVTGAGAVVLTAVACMAADAVRRKSLVKVLFNGAQYVLSLGAATVVVDLLAGVPHPGTGVPFTPADVPAVIVGAVVFFLVNSLVVAAVIALLERESVWGYFSQDFVFQAASAGLTLGLSPIVVIAADFSFAVVPLLALPLLAVAQYQRQAAVNEHQALHDALSGLPNRTLFRERVAHAVRFAVREDRRIAVMLLDLDHFKEINDTLGHHSGDLLLTEAAARLAALADEHDATVARLGGDEFGVLLDRLDDRRDATDLARVISAELALPFDVGGTEIAVGSSIGVAVLPEHGDDTETLIQRADVAMYAAKRGKLGVQLYRPEDDVHDPARLELAGELRRAVAEGGLVPFFQPKIDIATGVVVGFEALMRWEHPTRGRLSPAEFIPLIEQAGLIGEATFAMLEGALAQVTRWQARGIAVPVSVNLSARSLLDRRLPRLVAEMLERHAVAPAMLELEITETTIMTDAERAESILDELEAMGCRLAIDDFGTGYSSLVYLRRLPVTTLKIDRSFVADLAHSQNDAVIVRSTIDLAHNLGLQTVAEGVEDHATLEVLARLGCDVAQGFVIGRPVPAAEAERWLVARSAPAVTAGA